MPVMPGRIGMLVPVRVLPRGMGVQVGMPAVVRWGMEMKPPCVPPRPQAKSHQHHSDNQFQPAFHGCRHHEPRRHEYQSDSQHDRRMPKTPPHAEPDSHGNPRPVSKKRVDRYHVINLEGVGCPEGNRRYVRGPDIFH